MTGQIVRLKHIIGECENSTHAYVRGFKNSALSFALAQVTILVALYGNEQGFSDNHEDETFEKFVDVFGQYENGIEDRGGNAYRIETLTALTQEEEATMEKAIMLVPSILVVNPDAELKTLFDFIKVCVDNGEDVDSAEILECNQPLSKAIIIMRDLVRAEHNEWTDEAEAKFIEEFGE